MRSIADSLTIIRSEGFTEAQIDAVGRGDQARLDEWATGLLDVAVDDLMADDEDDEDFIIVDGEVVYLD